MANTSSAVFGHGRPTVGPGGPIKLENELLKNNEGRFLGQKTEYKTTYDPTLLNPVPRQENRNKINIYSNNLPFIGYDIWNCYEWSPLLFNGSPYTGIVKIKYPCTTSCIIESKSLKLYLNSFNLTFTGTTIDDSINLCEMHIRTDLSNALKCKDVEVKIYTHNDYNTIENSFSNFENFINIDILANKITCTEYNENNNLLDISISCQKEYKYVSNILYSRCQQTGQPDHGSIYIKYIPKNYTLNEETLFKYIVSLRMHKMFHEPVCETIFNSIYKKIEPWELLVGCFYTRRGGIDIDPIRSTSSKYLEQFDKYIDIKVPSFKLARQ